MHTVRGQSIFRWWNREQCRERGGTMIWEISLGGRFSLCQFSTNFIWFQHFSMPRKQWYYPFLHQRFAIFRLLQFWRYKGVILIFWCTFIIFQSNKNKASLLIQAGPRDVVPPGWTPISIPCLLCVTYYSSLPLLLCTHNFMVKWNLNMYFFNSSQGNDFWDQVVSELVFVDVNCMFVC